MEKTLIYNNRLTDTTYVDFQVLWFNKSFDNQRYGQAFCNYFGITDPELFYATDGPTMNKIIQDYLDHYQIYGQ